MVKYIKTQWQILCKDGTRRRHTIAWMYPESEEKENSQIKAVLSDADKEFPECSPHTIREVS